MRLCKCLTLALATAAALVSGPTTALAAADDRPTCAGADSGDFPIRTRIHGGPASYVAGGGFRPWSLDLTNTTSQTCANIHPVVVLTDAGHALKRTQPQLEFYEGGDEPPRPVTFEETDSDELVGVFDGSGFTVPAGRTLTVKVRLSLTSDAAVPNDVVANAAVVERRGDDGEWVGESNDYRFRITDGEEDEDQDEDEDENTGEDEGEDADTGGDEDAGGDRDRDGGGDSHADGGGDGSGNGNGNGNGEGDGNGSGSGSGDGVREPGSYAGELAGTGAAGGARPYGTGLPLLFLSVGGLLVAAGRRMSR